MGKRFLICQKQKQFACNPQQIIRMDMQSTHQSSLPRADRQQPEPLVVAEHLQEIVVLAQVEAVLVRADSPEQRSTKGLCE